MKEHHHDTPASGNDPAAEWFVRLKDDEVSAGDRRRYVRWLKRSPSHIADVLQTARLYKGLKIAQLPTAAPEPNRSSNVTELVARGDYSRATVAADAEGQQFSTRVRMAAAVGFVTLAGVIGVVAKLAFFSNRIETAEAEWRQFELADGSVMSAGPRTLLRIDFDDQRRYIELQRGEAVFGVTKDPKRAFLVDAGELVVRAVGTEFGVVRREDTVTVTVAEGQVAVSPAMLTDIPHADVKLSAPVALVADEQVSVSRGAREHPIVVQKVSATRELAWARGRLIFDTETVQEAVEEFNRRNRMQIRVEDPGIASRPACCVFDAADPESFAESIAVAPDVALEREGPNVLRLVPEAPQPSDGGPQQSDPM